MDIRNETVSVTDKLCPSKRPRKEESTDPPGVFVLEPNEKNTGPGNVEPTVPEEVCASELKEKNSGEDVKKQIVQLSQDETDAEVNNIAINRVIDNKQLEINNMKLTLVPVNKYDPQYKMDHPKRGFAYIFNFENVPGLKKREGSEEEAKRFLKVYNSLGFQTEVMTDYRHQDMVDRLAQIAQQDHSECDCLLITIMSHGSEDYFGTTDEPFLFEDLWGHFFVQNCKTLAGKPKLFFINMCRGPKIDFGETVHYRPKEKTVTDASVSYKLPSFADFLIYYSSPLGYKCWRSPTHGSLFGGSLCQVLEGYGKGRGAGSTERTDLLALLTEVSRTVATKEQKDPNYKVQVPELKSYLIRNLFLEPKNLSVKDESEMQAVKLYKSPTLSKDSEFVHPNHDDQMMMRKRAGYEDTPTERQLISEQFARLMNLKLRSLPDKQDVFAQRIINETMFQAEMDALSANTSLQKEQKKRKCHVCTIC